MVNSGFSVIQAFSIAGSTFLIGITIGWVLALFHLGNSAGVSNYTDGED